jgi:hypothetical protein
MANLYYEIQTGQMAGSIQEKSFRAAFRRWLQSFPKESMDRLRTINISTTSSRHVILTLTYGLYDPNIRRVNRMITGLLIARLRAERAGKSRVTARINEFMDDMHAAIDQATGTRAVKHSSAPPCNRPRQAVVGGS